MSVVFREYGFRFIVYVDDHPPAHVHVEGKGGSAKIALEGPVLIWSHGLGRRDVNRVVDVVRSNSIAMLSAWQRIHG